MNQPYLQDDQVFAMLGGEGGEPRRHSPLCKNVCVSLVMYSKAGIIEWVSAQPLSQGLV